MNPWRMVPLQRFTGVVMLLSRVIKNYSSIYRKLLLLLSPHISITMASLLAQKHALAGLCAFHRPRTSVSGRVRAENAHVHTGYPHGC